MMRRVAALATVLLLLAACGSQSDVRNGAGTGSAAPSLAPALVGMGLSGEHLDISTYRGHPVVIYFWASWCDPCRTQQPDLNALAIKYPSVHFIGDDVRDDAAAARAYVLDLMVRYPSVLDPSSVNISSYQATAIPTVIVANSKGANVGRYLGTVSGISQQLDALLSSGG